MMRKCSYTKFTLMFLILLTSKFMHKNKEDDRVLNASAIIQFTRQGRASGFL